MMMKGGDNGRKKRLQSEKDHISNVSTDEGVQSPSPAKQDNPSRIMPEESSPMRDDIIPGYTDVKTIEDIDFMYVYLRDKWQEVAAKIGGITPFDLFVTCRQKWFDKTFNTTDKKSKATPDLLIQPHYVYTPEELAEIEKEPLSYVTVIKDYIGKWGLDNNLFNIDYIQKKYGEYYTDIRVQTPLIEGFNLRSSKYLQEIADMKVDDYINYQKERKSMYLQDTATLDDKIKFAVNLDIGNFKDQLSELYTKVPSWVRDC